MRIVTWNIAGGPAEHKLQALVDRFEPDIVALQEVAASRNSDQQIWTGPNQSRGLLVWAKSPLHLRDRPFPCRTQAYQLIQVMLGNTCLVDLFNLWVKPFARSPLGQCSYGFSLVTALSLALRRTRRSRRVFVGDSNIVSPASKLWYQQWLGRCGLGSAYHRFTGESPGSESQATLWHRVHKKGYHIDWCFVPRPWIRRGFRATIGDKDDWSRLSDHLPLIVDLPWRPSR